MKRKILDFNLNLWQKGYLYIIILILYYLWWLFSGNVGVLDWFKEIAYFDYIRTSLKDYNMLPYYWWNIIPDVAWRPPLPGSSSFVAVPETTFFSPLTPLLSNLNTFAYAKLYVFFHFIPGVIGVFALRKKLQWTDEQFRIFAALFLFSPIVLQHVAVGYFTWYNFYYFPWMIFFMSEKSTFKSIVGTAAVLGLVVLQGGIYIVQYMGLFWLMYEIFHIILEKDLKRVLRIIFVPMLMLVLSWARIGSSVIVYGDYVRPWFEIDAYNISFFLFYAFLPTITIPPIDLWFHTDYLGWALTPHDSGQFWGLSLIMLAVVVLRYKAIVKNAKSKERGGLNYHAIFIAASFLFIISFYRIWYDSMRALALLNIPLIETIKNHGIRFIMGAYFGYAILLATYSSEIWKQLDIFVRTKIWSILKSMLKYLGYAILIGTGLFYSIMIIFKNFITDKFVDIVTAAYNNTGHFWLRNRMEGIQQNDLEFYFYRFDIAFASIRHWTFVILAIALFFFISALLINKNKHRFASLISRFPHLKYELLLIIPLAFSTGMWMNLSTSVPFDYYPIQKAIPPDVIVQLDKTLSIPGMEVAPDKLILIPKSEIMAEGYVFSNLPFNDHKLFEIISQNAEFFDSDGNLALRPYNNESIEIQYITKPIDQAIRITVIAWSMLGVLVFAQLIVKLKKNKIK